MELNTNVIAGIIAFLFGTILAFFVGYNSLHNPSRRSFAIVTQLAALWCLFPVAAAYGNGGELSLFLVRLVYIPGVLVPPLILQFIFDVTEDRRPLLKKVVLWPAYFVALFFIIFIFNPQFIAEVQKYEAHYVFVPGNIFHFFTAQYILVCLISFALLLKNLQVVKSANRVKLQYVAIASTLGIFSPIFHFSSSYYKWEPFPHDLFFFVYSSIIAYAIVRHQLMDIEIVIRRTAVFAGIFAFVYGVFTVFTILGQEIFESYLGWNQWVSMIPTALIIIFTLRPLENFLSEATDKFLFQKKYDYRELLKVFTTEILTVLQLDKLTQQTIIGLNNIVKVESAGMFLLNKDLKVYGLVAGTGIKQKDTLIPTDSPLANYFNATSLPLLLDKAAESMGQGALKEIFKQLNCKLALPLEVHDELIGILCLGMKKSGEDYTQEDVDILMALARTLAIAISNARLFDELSKTQAEAAQREKMAVIGTLAAGINHEICNPLGIVRGQCEMFLLNLRDGLYKDKTPDDLLKLYSEIMTKVIRETDRATAITKRLSSFSKPIKMAELSEVPVEKQVDEVMELLGAEMRLNNIDVQKDFPANFPAILADKKMIEEIMFNIIRNAAQAIDTSAKRGRIVVSGFQDGDRIVIRITDNGSGIPPEKVDQIFHPFYTTKAPGKGTGLGLFIVRQMVEKNKGSIAVESEFGVGTTFSLSFPTVAAAKLSQQAA